MRRVPLILVLIPLLAAWSDPRDAASHYGYTLTYDHVADPNMGYADEANRALHVNADLDEPQRSKVAYHEVGHARWWVTYIPRPGVAVSTWRTQRTLYHGNDQSVREDYAETYSWCIGGHPLGTSWLFHADGGHPSTSDCDAL